MLRPWLPPRAPSASFELPVHSLIPSINPTLAPFSPLYTLYCFENPKGPTLTTVMVTGSASTGLVGFVDATHSDRPDGWSRKAPSLD